MNICCRLLVNEYREIPSPFARLVATGYYDGPTEGVVECHSCLSHFWFSKIDWDDGQDMRIFELKKISETEATQIDILMKAVPHSSKEALLPAMGKDHEIERLLGCIQVEPGKGDLVIAATDLLGWLAVWRPLSEPRVNVDWFAEFGLSRQGS